MKYKDLKPHLVVQIPDGTQATIVRYGPLIVDGLDNDVERAKVTVRLINGELTDFRSHQLEPGDQNILANQAMAHFFPAPKD